MGKGTVKEGRGTMVGNSGEYFVVASLLKRGVIASLTPRNTPDFDILAMDGNRSINVRVKTKSAPSSGWQWMAKKDRVIYKNIKPNFDFVVLVDLKQTDDYPDFYFFPTDELNEILMRDFAKWVEIPGKKKPHNAESRHRLFGQHKDHKKLLEQAKNNWKVLGLEYKS